MSDDEIMALFRDTDAPDTSGMSYTQACNANDLAGLRAVERAARAAAFSECIALCEAVENGRLPTGEIVGGLAWECIDALRARAEGGA